MSLAWYTVPYAPSRRDQIQLSFFRSYLLQPFAAFRISPFRFFAYFATYLDNANKKRFLLVCEGYFFRTGILPCSGNIPNIPVNMNSLGYLGIAETSRQIEERYEIYAVSNITRYTENDENMP